jgi:hypothetical protein
MTGSLKTQPGKSTTFYFLMRLIRSSTSGEKQELDGAADYLDSI